MDTDRHRIVFLDWLRFAACFLVMLIHACECIYSNDYSFAFPTETDRWSIACISGFARPAVPLFLMASAYLLVPVRQDLLGFFRRRLSRVFVPFAVWRPNFRSPFDIFATAAATYVSSYLLCLVLSRIPILRRSVG